LAPVAHLANSHAEFPMDVNFRYLSLHTTTTFNNKSLYLAPEFPASFLFKVRSAACGWNFDAPQE
jgi:hypothetical protein